MQTSENYKNPLDSFRSYSYHFIMTAASTTEAFRKMVQNDGRNMLASISDKMLGDQFSVDGSTAYLVMDTRRFSQYSVTSIEMQHVYGTGSRVNPSVPASELKMKVLDVTGLSFFGFMMDLMRLKLQTTRASAFFLLSILFVGHRDDGSTETISTCHIPLTLLLMGFEFTHKGSEYDIIFMELEGAPQRGGSMQQINYLGNVKSVSTNKNGSNTLGELIDNLEDSLNLQSLELYQKYQNDQMKLTGSKLKLGKLVQYMITIPDTEPDNWRQFKVTGASRSKNKEQSFLTSAAITAMKSTATGSDNAKIESSSRYSQITFSAGNNITDAIKIILESSDDFLKLSSEEKVKAGTGKVFKTVTNITCDDTTYVIHFDIYPYIIPKLDVKKDKLNVGDAQKRMLGSKDQIKNVIKYDYIFTGYNSHIKDLKIQYNPESAVALDSNIDIGGARLADNAAKGNTPKAASEMTKGAEKTSQSNSLIRPGDPILPAIITKDQQSNNSKQLTEEYGKNGARDKLKAKQEYSNTMASLHFLSSLTVDMTVRGNPNIIRKFADRNERGGIAPHTSIISSNELNLLEVQSAESVVSNFKTIKRGLSSAKQQYLDEYVRPRIKSSQQPKSGTDEVTNGIDVATMPLFVLLNIKAPNVDWTGNFKNDTFYTDEFFYNGYYQVLLVTTNFAGGDFEHSMTLIPYITGADDVLTKNDPPPSQNKKKS